VSKFAKHLMLNPLRRLCRIAAWPVVGLARDLGRDTRAGVMMMMAFSLLALAAASGAAIDFARGLNFKLALQSAADAAALAGATEYLNTGSQTNAQSLATAYIANAKSELPPSSSVTTNVNASASGTTYTVVVTASGSIAASFLGVIENSIPVSVTATASSSGAPNIDFYLLLDSSPSMAIAATTDGINMMVANTQSQCDATGCGCGFGCHQSDPAKDNLGNKNTQGKVDSTIDNYQLARNLGVTLRMDLLTSATSNLMTTAQTTEESNNAKYRMAIYTFDINFNKYQTLTSSLSSAEASAATISMLEVYANNILTCPGPSPCTQSDNPTDVDTNYDNAMSNINSVMVAPGNGTNARGDTPQEVLFFVTDGVEDENVGGNRQQSLMDNGWCTKIKNRGIRIAVLYTQYLPLPTNQWYTTYISPFQPQIASNMQSCASPGLFFQVNVDGDISAAMSALFQSAVKTAYLTH
jgi:Flp pilus assembly protein TadG